MIRFKSDVHHVFLEFQAHVECLLNRKIISVQSDWGGEYQCLNSYLKYVGIQHHISCPHTHQQNGVAECKHRHIVETGLALLAHSSLPLQFLDEAFITVCYLINQLPSKSLRLVTPFEHLLAKQPSYDQLRVFSSRCWPNLRPYNSTKLSFRSMPCVFLGYSSMHKGYKCHHVPIGHVYLSRDVIYLSRDVIFDEDMFPFAHNKPTLPEHITETTLLPTLHLAPHPASDQHTKHTILPPLHDDSNSTLPCLDTIMTDVQVQGSSSTPVLVAPTAVPDQAQDPASPAPTVSDSAHTVQPESSVVAQPTTTASTEVMEHQHSDLAPAPTFDRPCT
jgi:hypothetical protein